MQFCFGKISQCTTAFIFAIFLSFAGSAAPQRLNRHIPSEASNAGVIGRLSATKQFHLSIGLPIRNSLELSQLLAELYDPASAEYRHFLTPDEFAARFAPRKDDYQAVAEYFKRQGFTIVATHPNRLMIEVSGAVGEIEKTMHVTMREYRHPHEPRTYFAPDADPVLDLDIPIVAISGLDNYVLPKPASLHARALGEQAVQAVPNSGSGPNGTYMGADFRAAYAPDVTLRGQGQHVALVQFDGYYPNDIASYVSQAGLTNVPLRNVLVDGVSGAAGPDNVEVALDIEMCISMAPGLSSIIVYEGLYGNDILNKVANDNLARQVSASWIYPTDATTENIFRQMAAQGQSYFNASGDSGAWVGSIPTPCDSPNVTSVGGTTLSTAGPGLGWVSEKVWNWGNGAGSGGGVSTSWSMPSWQQGIANATNQGSATRRNIPDVAMIADQVLVISGNGQKSSVGGTSVASPLWAAFMALVNEQASKSGRPPIGFLNPAIYPLGKGGSFSALLHDTTTGNNTTASSPSRFYACPGYDLCTGWGTPVGSTLINALAPAVNAPLIVAGSATLNQEGCSPANGVIDPGETVTVSLTLQNQGGADTTNLTATLLSTNGVIAITPVQSYGVLKAGAAAVSKQFTFVANGNCGGVLTPALKLQDNTTSLGTVTYTNMQLGVPVVVLSENFDGVSSPGLPGGWTVAQSGGGTAWVTSTNSSDTSPKAAFAAEPATAGTTELVSPPIAITSDAAQLSFKNNFNTEPNTSDATAAYDGGVLEMSVGGGSFSDIVAAGGSFVSGGYTRTIRSTENPLNGRAAWAGASGGFISSVVKLPASAVGQTVRFKWRLGFDTGNFYGGTGWYIDSISLQDYRCCMGVATLQPPRINLTVNSSNVSVTVSSSVLGIRYALEYKNNLIDLSWTAIPGIVAGNGDTIVLRDTNAPGSRRFFRVRAE